ncbi:MAG: O-antigen ligase family protein [Saprospiraceae bacterium]
MKLLSGYKSTYFSGIIVFLAVMFIFIVNKKYEYSILFGIVVLAVSMILISFRWLLVIISFLTPLSISLSYFKDNSPLDISLFTEPFLILMLGVLFVKFLMYNKLDKKLWTHPITISITAMLFWILISALNSTLPLVSLKYFISKLWLILPVLIFGYYLFNKKVNINYFIWAQVVSIIIVVIISTFKLYLTFGLKKNSTHFAVIPFYDDHTAYGAILALFIPVVFAYIFIFKNKLNKLLAIFAFIMLMLGLILSYSRASWLGIVLAIGILILIKLKINFKYLAFFSILSGLFIYMFWFQIIDTLEKNNQESSSNLSSHILSITNISTDASNVERLNRWYCAIEMFKNKPLFGYGPGTYQFEYAPFQLNRMRTIISTNFGDVGNAHSEYLGALAEQGLPGAVIFIILSIVILYYSFTLYYKSTDNYIRFLALGIGLGFITYFFHGLLNNFLTTDKIAIPFFGFATILITLDIKNNKTIEIKRKSE